MATGMVGCLFLHNHHHGIIDYGGISTVWFMIGGLIHMKQLFRDLEARVANPLDDGRVEGHVSIADKARFDEIEHQEKAKE